MTSVAVFPLGARKFDLLRQGVKIDQDEASELMGLNRLLLANAVQVVNGIVADSAKLVRPVFQRFCESSDFGELIDAVKKAQSNMFGRHLFGRDFESAAIHGASRLPVPSLDGIFGLDESSCDVVRNMARRGGGLRFREEVEIGKLPKAGHVTLVSDWRVVVIGIVSGNRQRFEAGVALKEYVPRVGRARFFSLANLVKTGALRSAMRAIVSEGNHVSS